MYPILSLDGGGSWAVLQVMALQEIFGADATGHDVLANFRLVAANSGGSLTLGGLIENKTLLELRNDFFLNLAERQSVFVHAGFFNDPEAAVLRLVGIGAKYRADAKLQGLRRLFARYGDTRLSQLREKTGRADFPDIVIAGFDYDRTRGYLFRSNRASRARNQGDALDPTLAEAVHASSNAPVLYFDAPARVQNQQFWDGGVSGYNNPVLIAVIEALANDPQSDICALSIGTGTVFLPFDPDHSQPPELVQRPRTSAPIADLRELATAIVDDPPDVASFHAHVALRGALPGPGPQPTASPVVRLNALIQPVGAENDWRVPPGLTPRDFSDLLKLPVDAIEQHSVELIVKLGQAWISDQVLNQPVRTNRQTLGCEIGYRHFSEGLAAWRGFARGRAVTV
ncbi:MAG: patatin-like phospholipase family protein [Acetobacteraceae bacterium]|nr:patatin-like phospholipase family protein [Acetobacteraceae bacterium]